MGDGKRTPHVVRRERPPNPTTPISTVKLAELVQEVRATEQTLELPAAVPGDEDLIELTVDDNPPPPKRTRNAHVVRRPKKP